MPLDAQDRKRLLKALEYLGSQNADTRAKAAKAISDFAARSGGWEALLTAPRGARSPRLTTTTTLPDTPWRKLPNNKDGCAGYRRRYNCKVLVVRECRPAVPGTAHPPGRPWDVKWYVSVDGEVLVYSGNGQARVFDTEFWAKQNAEWAAGSGEDE